ncbi:MAG: OadG family protein [Clostridia bacterium]|nr:OadG family protein [Clostridia bacterium]
MTVQEALAQGLSVTGVGVAIVFAVLVILMLVMMLMKKIFYKEPAKAKAAAPVAAPEPVAKVDEGELIAVLTAAIAASLNTSTYNLQIKSYRRIENKKPAWNRAGVTETINSRY